MPNLRGHHLICLHFFEGEGYNQEFVNNLKRILKRAGSEKIRISAGVDDICCCCPHMKENSCRYNEHSDSEIGEMDNRALDLLRIPRDSEIGWGEVMERVPRIFSSWYELYCTTCGWKWACEKNGSYRQLRAAQK